MNRRVCMEFLRRWRPDGPWVLTAISLDQKKIDTATFETDEGVVDWLTEHEARNHYFHVNPTTRPLTKKAERRDMRALAWLHVDVDARAGEDLDEEFARIRTLFDERRPAGVPEPTVLVFSGGGYQAFWRLREPLAIDGDLDAAEDAKRYNLQLELLFGADNCHNVDRIMRLPGTVNRPNEKKRKKGRVEREAEVVWFRDHEYDLSEFTRAARVDTGGGSKPTVQVSGNVRRLTDVHELDQAAQDGPCPDWLKVLVVQGNHPDDEEQYESRSEALFAACCEMVRCGVDDDTIYAVITDPDFQISASVLDKGSGIERYALRQIERARENAENPWLVELNDRYAVIQNMGGKCRVVEEVVDEGLDRAVLTTITFQDFANAWLHERIEIGRKGKNNEIPVYETVGKWWLYHPKRRTYERIVFSPGHEVPGAYNMWRGFAVDAIPGDCDEYLSHVRDNICSGNQEHYDYLLRWMARAVQCPGEPGLTAIVLRGKQGIGKGFFVETFGRLFGRHFLPVSNSKHLVGDFNAHLQDCVLLFGDEAFYAGDRKHESVLKTLITEPRLTVERKGVDAVVSRNCVHLIMASNEQWVVPADVDDRRFFALDVSPARARDTEYFRGLGRHMVGGGGREALLHYLLNLDLSGFDVRTPPTTEALTTQKELSLKGPLEWWLTKLRDGRVSEEHDGWETLILCSELQYDFATYAKIVSRGTHATRTQLGMLLKDVCGEVGRRVGNQPRDCQKLDGSFRTVNRPTFYEIPDLETCRRRWTENFFPEEWSEARSVDNPAEKEPPDGGGCF